MPQKNKCGTNLPNTSPFKMRVIMQYHYDFTQLLTPSCSNNWEYTQQQIVSFHWLGGVVLQIVIIKTFHKPGWSARWMNILMLPGKENKKAFQNLRLKALMKFRFLHIFNSFITLYQQKQVFKLSIIVFKLKH